MSSESPEPANARLSPRGETLGGNHSQRGAKEEIRVAMLRPYLLRVRDERGEGAVDALLENAAVAPRVLDDERAWVSEAAATRILRALTQALNAPGTYDALADRGAYMTHPDALATRVRMLRSAEFVVDAYVHLADNSAEETRLGYFRLEGDAAYDRRASSHRERLQATTLRYHRRPDAAPLTAESEALFCAARRGELAGLPQFWGLASAKVAHPECLAEGGTCCRYDVSWSLPSAPPWALLAGVGAATTVGFAAFALGTVLAGVLAGLAAGALAAFVGRNFAEAKIALRTRTFEDLRLKALERGLVLKGELKESDFGDLIGSVLGGKYRIRGRLGSGGMGTVYSAEHMSLGHEVAVKVLRGAAAKDGGEIARLRREAYIQTRIDHPSIARVHDLDQMPDGSIYVVMDRLVGRPLSDLLAEEAYLPVDVALPIFQQVCAGLAAAHAKGVVHRDLKPGNIFLCEDGTTKLLDFGMSKLLGTDRAQGGGATEVLTQAGYTLGTPEYMAPEQCTGAPVGPATDLYALGVLMYETLTGELPIRAHHRKELLELHQSQIPVSMAASMPELGIPARLDDTVMVCLEKRPAARPLSALALAEKLEEVAFELRPDSARTPSHVRPFRRISGDFSRADGDARRTLASLLGADPEGDEEEKT